MEGGGVGREREKWKKSLINYECTQSIIEQCHFFVFMVELMKNYVNYEFPFRLLSAEVEALRQVRQA